MFLKKICSAFLSNAHAFKIENQLESHHFIVYSPSRIEITPFSGRGKTVNRTMPTADSTLLPPRFVLMMMMIVTISVVITCISCSNNTNQLWPALGMRHACTLVYQLHVRLSILGEFLETDGEMQRMALPL